MPHKFYDTVIYFCDRSWPASQYALSKINKLSTLSYEETYFYGRICLQLEYYLKLAKNKRIKPWFIRKNAKSVICDSWFLNSNVYDGMRGAFTFYVYYFIGLPSSLPLWNFNIGFSLSHPIFKIMVRIKVVFPFLSLL